MASEGDRPNVVLLLADQQRYDVAAPDGPDVETPTPDVETPTIDRLREEGTWFENAYSPISICTASRVSLLTGLYPHNHAVRINVHEPYAYVENVPEGTPTFSEPIADRGYELGFIGKWHLGRDQVPADFEFEYLGEGEEFHGKDGDEGLREFQREHGVDPDEADPEEPIYAEFPNGELLVAGRSPVPEEATAASYFADRAIEFLEDRAGGEDPFFLEVAFVDPHFAYTPPEPYASAYDPAEIGPWNSYDETFEGKPRAHEQYVRYRGVDDFDWATWAEVAAKCFGLVSHVDDQMGRIVDALDDLGIADETLVVHASDHGDMLGHHREFNKGPMMYEDTYQVPMVARWPGVVEAGATREAFVSVLDLMPTFVDVTGADLPAEVDGRSLRPLFDGAPAEWRDSIFAEYHGDEFGWYTQRMVHDGEFKYVYNGPDVDELYHLERDPHELNNLAEHPEYEDRVQELQGELLRWMERTDDPKRTWLTEFFGDGSGA